MGSKVFTQYGWRADAALNVGWTFLTVIIQLVRGPHVPLRTWFGWKGGCYPILKPKVTSGEKAIGSTGAEDTDTDGAEIVETVGEKGTSEKPASISSSFGERRRRSSTESREEHIVCSVTRGQ